MEEKVYDKFKSEGWGDFSRNGNFYILTKGTEIVIINRAFNSIVKGPIDLSAQAPGAGNI